MQLNPKSVQIAGVATATMVVFGLTVASATKTEPVAQQSVSPRVSPGAAAVEETENDDAATPEPASSPSPAATAAPKSSSKDSDHDDSDDDGRHSNNRDARRQWREDARRQWREVVRELNTKHGVRPLRDGHDHGNHFGQRHD